MALEIEHLVLVLFLICKIHVYYTTKVRGHVFPRGSTGVSFSFIPCVSYHRGWCIMRVKG